MFASASFRLSGLLPGLFTLGLMLLLQVLQALPGMQAFQPHILLLAVFYWGTYRPEYFPLWLVFALGLLQDVLLAYPLGLHAFWLLVFYLVVLKIRDSFRLPGFFSLWFCFAVVAFGAQFSLWALNGLIQDHLFSFYFTVFMPWLLTLLLYPAFHMMARHIHLKLPLPSTHAE